jgi:hypothetical protein
MATAEKPTGLALLREPFPANQISKLPKPYKKDSEKGNCRECGQYHGLPAMHLDYVGHAALTDRLLDADPLWTWEPVDAKLLGLPASNDGMWIKLTVCGVSRYGFGSADGKTGGNAIKEMIGDALRNAAMRFGAALDLWHKGQLHEDEDQDEAQEKKPQQGKPEPPKAKQPDGYEDWLLTFSATANSGLPALRKAFADQKAAKYRDYLTNTDKDRYEQIRARAEAVTKQETAA